MHNQILRRVGSVLLAIGLIGGMVAIVRFDVAGLWLTALNLIPVVAAIFLLWGGPRAALWVRMLAVFLLAAGIAALVAAPFFQPLDLIVTEVRLDPRPFAIAAAAAAFLLGLLLWISWQLGRPPVGDAIASARIRAWDIRMAAQAGAGVTVLAAFLLWLTLHGQTADLATSLASEQLGPNYRYHLSWISSSSTGHGTSVRGVVTAWNDKEIKQVLLHWEIP